MATDPLPSLETPSQPERLHVLKGGATAPRWRRYVNQVISAEISRFSRFYDRLIQYRPRETDRGLLLEATLCPRKSIAKDFETLPDMRNERSERTAILLNGNMNHDFDIQNTLTTLKSKLSRTSRVAVVAYNPYLRLLYSVANRLGIREGELPSTFVTNTDLANIAKLAGYEVVRLRPTVYCPFKMFGLGDLINHVLPVIPGLRWLSLALLVVLRPVITESRKPSISIIIPARNERGNIENALKRLPAFDGARREVIFIEGHSSDGTWDEIQKVIATYSSKFDLSALKQSGRGKSDAVRLGFMQARNELLVILDADLTMPPELLTDFYTAYCSGLADFINGNRLVYPMEGKAMRFLNRLGNIFFAKGVSFVLGTKLGDTLCGTKLVARHDYDRMVAWRKVFGDFDPFGDFELLFPASELALGIIDIPIRYRDRVYGSTNIRRFYHGWMLLKMTLVGFFGIKTGAARTR